MADRIFIGVDFSIVSPAVCIMKAIGGAKTFNWISVFKEDEKEQQKLMSKKDGPFNILDSTKSVSINFVDKVKKPNTTYSETERFKLVDFIDSADRLIRLIKDEIGSFKGEIYIAIEGVSFGASGNILIDISMATGILRERMLALVLNNHAERFYVFSPGSVKLMAGKGNFKKIDMYNAAIETELIPKDNEFIELMRTNKHLWTTPGGTVKKPVEDLCDSLWVCLLLSGVVNGSVVESNKVKSK